MDANTLTLARSNFTAFKVVMNNTYQRAAHLDLLDKALTEVVRYLETGKGIQRLIIEMPPQHGKSLTVSQLFPAWALGRNPWLRIILASYSAGLAHDHSRNARRYAGAEEFKALFPAVILDDDNQKVDNWSVHTEAGARGGMNSAGLGGSITGKSANLIIIDDPLKNRAEAESPTIRERIWNAYVNDLLTRFSDRTKAAQIVMATRWHADDLTGRILKQPNGWYRLRLPALAEPRDPLGRAEGEALWPERHPRSALLETERTAGSYAFASLYQQRPIPRGETLFDTSAITILPALPREARDLQMVRFYDLAVTKNRTSDYTVGLKLGIDAHENIYVLDVWRDRVKSPEMLRTIIRAAHRDGKHVPVVLEAEKAGIVQLDYLLEEPELRGYVLEKQAPHGDKVTRADAIATRAAHGKLFLIQGAWNEAFLDELSVFPAGAHDDQVDALSGAYNYLSTAAPTLVRARSLGAEL